MTDTLTSVEQILERKSHPVIRDASVAPTDDMHDRLLELEAKGEIILQRMTGDYVEFPTKYGRMKKIPIEHTWHHKFCGHCGHIPGYASSILWLHRQFNLDYVDPTRSNLLHRLELLCFWGIQCGGTGCGHVT